MTFEIKHAYNIGVKTQSAIDHFGSVAKLAAALGISRTAIYLWKDDVPQGRAFQLQLMTGGALQVDAAAAARVPEAKSSEAA